ncbi:MAG: hypothetical protein JW904_01460 [Spirochaetales bacterium]|nr:hypothetical protein [Spirochaetales bacterium]
MHKILITGLCLCIFLVSSCDTPASSPDALITWTDITTFGTDGWTNYDPANPVQYGIDNNNCVYIKGIAVDPIPSTNNSIVFTLPAEYCPSETQHLVIMLETNEPDITYGELQIDPDGSVYAAVYVDWVQKAYFTNISFFID